MALCCLALLATACADKQAEQKTAITTFLTDWYTQAREGKRDDSLCHGLGLLKHPDFTCADMLEAAATIDPATQQIEQIKAIDCFAGVCGDLFEINLTSQNTSGTNINETHILKRDDGQLRVYWYRNDVLMAQLRAANPIEEEKDPEQVAYDELIARYPTLYEYPPCYGVRPSSTNLAGKLMAMDAIDVDEINRIASTCDNFCFSVVGSKIAPLCPKN